jgi:hypothetical protein
VALCLGRPPRAWSRSRFVREVELVRVQLQPLGDPGLLARSYASEAFRRPGDGRRGVTLASAVRVAYAFRWAELLIGLRLPSLPAWLDAPSPSQRSEPCATA